METAPLDLAEELFPADEISARRGLADDGPSSRFVAFQLGSRTYCVPSESVAEISHPLEVTPLPLAPKSLIGICSVRGNLAAVTDLRKLLGEADTNGQSKPKFIVFRSRGADCPIAVPIDRVHDVISLPPDAFRVPDMLPNPYVVAVTGDSDALHLLNIEKVRCELSPENGA